ncbi:MAG: hypothetical protein IJF92_05655 [Bacilli bacterium]|nr:hypothetical protein [Bacilli bacterium]
MTNNCITNLLKLICLLQNNSIINSCKKNCTKPYLGSISNTLYNTRPINIYNKNGSLFTTNYNGSNISLFRIKEIKNNCAILTPLINNEGTLEATTNNININTNCICAIRCLNDVYINNL